MGWINISIDILLFLFVIDCVLMCLVVLMQRSKQEGLGAAFGGGFTESVWGAQTSNVLVKATCVLAAGFFLISIALAHLYSKRSSLEGKAQTQATVLEQELMKPGTPASTNATPANAVVPAVPATTGTSTMSPAQPAKHATK